MNNIIYSVSLFYGLLSGLGSFLACHHVPRRPCWWSVGGQYNRFFFSLRIDRKIGFSSQRIEMLCS